MRKDSSQKLGDTQGHMAGKWRSWDSNPELPITLHQDQSVPDGLGWGRVPEYVGPQGGVRQGTLLRVVLIILDKASQAEVSDLAHQLLPHKDIGCPQVAVDVVHALHVGHSLSHLEAKVWRDGKTMACLTDHLKNQLSR